MSKVTKIILGILFVLLLIPILWAYSKYTPDEYKQVFNLVTLIGGYISAYGLFVTILQIFALQNITQSTQTAVKETRERVEQILSVADLAKTVAILRIIEEYVNNDKYELAKLRLCDVKDVMMRIEFIEKINLDKEEFNKLRNRVEIGLNNLDKQIGDKCAIEKDVFCKDMEEVATMLGRLESQLKSK